MFLCTQGRSSRLWFASLLFCMACLRHLHIFLLPFAWSKIFFFNSFFKKWNLWKVFGVLSRLSSVFILYWKWKSLSHVWLFVTPLTVACQAPLSMEFSRSECWIGLPFPSPGNLPNPGIEPRSSTLQADSLPSEPPRKPLCFITLLLFTLLNQ